VADVDKIAPGRGRSATDPSTTATGALARGVVRELRLKKARPWRRGLGASRMPCQLGPGLAMRQRGTPCGRVLRNGIHAEPRGATRAAAPIARYGATSRPAGLGK
jgi:hypothetical protein